MADPVLMHVRTGRTAIVVLGSAQRELATSCSLPVRVRSSGGGAVLSGPWLLRSAIVLPRSHALAQHGPAAAARWYGDIHCRWLQRQGIDAAALHQGATVDHWACFAGRTAGEVMVGERKIVGIAQAWRGQTVLLSAGTLTGPAPWVELCDSLRRPHDAAAELEELTIDAQEYLRRPIDVRVWADELLRVLRLGAVAAARCSQPSPGCAMSMRPGGAHLY